MGSPSGAFALSGPLPGNPSFQKDLHPGGTVLGVSSTVGELLPVWYPLPHGCPPFPEGFRLRVTIRSGSFHRPGIASHPDHSPFPNYDPLRIGHPGISLAGSHIRLRIASDRSTAPFKGDLPTRKGLSIRGICPVGVSGLSRNCFRYGLSILPGHVPVLEVFHQVIFSIYRNHTVLESLPLRRGSSRRRNFRQERLHRGIPPSPGFQSVAESLPLRADTP